MAHSRLEIDQCTGKGKMKTKKAEMQQAVVKILALPSKQYL